MDRWSLHSLSFLSLFIFSLSQQKSHLDSQPKIFPLHSLFPFGLDKIKEKGFIFSFTFSLAFFMEVKMKGFRFADPQMKGEEEMDVRKGPWTSEEDSVLFDYISSHGEGHWNAVARCSGLKRTGKSCRLRWLNYLRPSVRRGNITLQEQLLILELHFRWGNRWSKIAQYLPGRTDNEIKNYWRTRVQKQAKQLKCDVNSEKFRDTMRYVWMPRLVERIQASTDSIDATNSDVVQPQHPHDLDPTHTLPLESSWVNSHVASTTSSSNSISDQVQLQVSPISDVTENFNVVDRGEEDEMMMLMKQSSNGTTTNGWIGGEGLLDDEFWNEEDMWFLQQQFGDDV